MSTELTFAETEKVKQNNKDLLHKAYKSGKHNAEMELRKMLQDKLEYGFKGESGDYYIGYTDACGELLETLND